MATNTKTLLTVKIDKKLKKRAQETAASFGLPLGTMVNALIRDTVESGRLELEIPNAKTRRAIREAEKEWKNGKLKLFDSVEDLIKDLDS